MASTQNTLIVIGDTTISTNIAPARIAKLNKVAKATGLTMTDMLDRATKLWLVVEAPVYLAKARAER